MNGTFPEACALVIGYDCAMGGALLDEFQQWVGARHDGRSEVAFWIHVLNEAFPSKPAIRVSELTEEQNRTAIDKLFELLDEYLAIGAWTADS